MPPNESDVCAAHQRAPLDSSDVSCEPASASLAGNECFSDFGEQIVADEQSLGTRRSANGSTVSHGSIVRSKTVEDECSSRVEGPTNRSDDGAVVSEVEANGESSTRLLAGYAVDSNPTDHSEELVHSEMSANSADDDSPASSLPVVTSSFQGRDLAGEHTLSPSVAPCKTELTDETPFGPAVEAERLNSIGAKFHAIGKTKEAIEVFQQAATSARAQLAELKERISKASVSSNNNDLQHLSHQAVLEKLNDDATHVALTLASILNNLGISFEMRCDYQQAIDSCKDALGIYTTICCKHKNTADYDKTIKNIIQLEMALATYPKRKELHEYAVWLADEASSIADVRVRKGEYGNALNTLRTVLHMECNSLGSSHPIVATTLMEIGKIHLETKQVDAAITEMNQAVRIYRQALGETHPDFGKALVSLACAYEQRNATTRKESNDRVVIQTDRESALHLYKKAIVVLSTSLGTEHPELGAIYNNVGATYFAQQDYDNALLYFAAARKAYYGQNTMTDCGEAVDKNAQFWIEIVCIWNNTGEVHLKKHEYRLSLAAFNSALSLLKKEGDDKPKVCSTGSSSSGGYVAEAMLTARKNKADHTELITSTLGSMASVYMIIQEYGNATRMYDEILKTLHIHEQRQRQQQQNRTSVTTCFDDETDTYLLNVARILELKGDAQQSNKDLSLAMSLYLQSLRLYQKKQGDKKQQQQDMTMALLLSKIGSIHFSFQEMDKAAVVLTESAQQFSFHDVSKDDPTYYNVLDQLAKINQKKKSMNFPESVRMDLSSIIGSNIIIPSHHRQEGLQIVVNELILQATYLSETMDYDGAMKVYKHVLSIQRRGSQNDDDEVEIARTLSHIAELHGKKHEREEARVLFKEALRIYKANKLPACHSYVEHVLSECHKLSKY